MMDAFNKEGKKLGAGDVIASVEIKVLLHYSILIIIISIINSLIFVEVIIFHLKIIELETST